MRSTRRAGSRHSVLDTFVPLNNVIERIAIAGYRSIRSIILRLGQLNVVTGANGSGKSNLYRALRFIADAADGRLAESLSCEGGFDSVRWAGPKKNGKDPVSLRLGLTADPLSYYFDLGLPPPNEESMFDRDPEMKRECLWRGVRMEPKNLCADRRVGTLRCRGASGQWQDIEMHLPRQSSMLSEYADPLAAPELIIMRETLRRWRFYDTFRVDARSPSRQSCVATFTPIMAGDGADLTLAAENSQVIVVSHNAALVNHLEADAICVPIRLAKEAGETVLQDADLLSQYGWKWPSR